MSISRVFHGARAQVFINGALNGIFTSVSGGPDLTVGVSHILGRMGPMETQYLAQEAIQLNCTGWRVLNNGPYSSSVGVPKLQDMLTADDITISVYDRATGQFIMTVVGCKSQGWNTSMNSKSQTELNLRFIGLRLDDEETPNGQAEAPGASSF